MSSRSFGTYNRQTRQIRRRKTDRAARRSEQTTQRQLELDDLRQIVFARAAWRCEAAGTLATGCGPRAGEPWRTPNADQLLEAHHRQMRSQGGPDTVENLIAVCPAHHDQIHHEIDAAYRLGLLIESWKAAPKIPWDPLKPGPAAADG